MWNLKYDTNEHIHETKTDLQRLPGGLGEARTGRLGLTVCRLFYIGWINNKVLLYTTGNYIQYLVTNHNEKEHICINKSLCCRTAFKHCKSTILQ